MHGAVEGAIPVRIETETLMIQPRCSSQYRDIVHSETGERRRLSRKRMINEQIELSDMPYTLAFQLWTHGEPVDE